MHVVFVCATNICLSPTAASLLGELADQQKLNVTAGSAASLDTYAGKPAHKLAIKTAAARGIDLSKHTARKIEPADFTESDIVIVFDRSDLRLLMSERPRGCRTDIRLFSSLIGTDGPSDIAEPTGDDSDRFEASYETIENGVRDVLAGLRGRLAAMEVNA